MDLEVHSMDNRETNILGSLNKKLSTVNELLRVTQLAHLTGDNDKFEKEAQDYIYMIESRENLINEINELDQRLASAGYTKLKQSEGYVFPMQIKTVEDDIKDVLKQLIELDKTNNQKANVIFAKLKNAIKGVNLSRNISTAYQRNAMPHVGHYDMKR
jgi:hypothetical protein